MRSRTRHPQRHSMCANLLPVLPHLLSPPVSRKPLRSSKDVFRVPPCYLCSRHSRFQTPIQQKYTRLIAVDLRPNARLAFSWLLISILFSSTKPYDSSTPTYWISNLQYAIPQLGYGSKQLPQLDHHTQRPHSAPPIGYP